MHVCFQVFLSRAFLQRVTPVVHWNKIFYLKDIEEYVKGPSQYPLVIHGKSGSGKTAIIALAAKAISEFMDQKACFCLR